MRILIGIDPYNVPEVVVQFDLASGEHRQPFRYTEAILPKTSDIKKIEALQRVMGEAMEVLVKQVGTGTIWPIDYDVYPPKPHGPFPLEKGWSIE